MPDHTPLATPPSAPGALAGESLPWPGFPEAGRVLDRGGRWTFDGWFREGDLGWLVRLVETSRPARRAMRILRPEVLAAGDSLPEAEPEGQGEQRNADDLVVRHRESGWLEPAAPVTGRWPYLLTPWVEGRSLRDVLRTRSHGVLPEQAFHLAGQLARAVAALHRQGQVHGHLTPDAVMVTADNRVRLLHGGVPLGWRKWARDNHPGAWAHPYTAPELAGQKAPAGDPREDVFQLGVLLYELFAGAPCSPWVVPEPLSEIVDYAPPALDRLIRNAIGHRDDRPADARTFLALLLEAETAFETNQRDNRPRAQERARDTWTLAQELAGSARPPWFAVAGLCQRLLGQRPHLLPFGTVPERPVRDLLAEAESRLQGGRREYMGAVLHHQGFAAAEAVVEGWAAELPAEQRDELRLELAAAALSAPETAGERTRAAHRSLLALLKAPEATPANRARAVELLEAAWFDTPGPAAVAAVEPPAGCPVVDRWWVHDRWWQVVVGPALRLGRGSWAEFGNHLDLRPTREEAAENSYCLTLAQTLSRAGHLEFRVNGAVLEAVCLGSAGAMVDGALLRRGEARPLASQGTCILAGGAAVLEYTVVPGAEGSPLAVALEFTAGVGQGRRAVWVLQHLPLEILLGDQAPAAALVPGPGGWQVAARAGGVILGGRTLAPGDLLDWGEGVPLAVEDGRTITRG